MLNCSAFVLYSTDICTISFPQQQLVAETYQGYFFHSDIDECDSGEHTCVAGEECFNTEGSYRCKPLPPCPQGFKRHPDTHRCVGELYISV